MALRNTGFMLSSKDGADNRGGYPGMTQRFGRTARAALSAAAMASLLAACSTAPEWARPGIIYGDESAAAASAEQTSTDSDFPEIQDVPDRPQDTSSAAERERIAEGLAADRERSRYTDEVLRGGTEPPASAPRVAEPTPLPSLPKSANGDRSNASDAGNDTAGVIPPPPRGGRRSLNGTAQSGPTPEEAAKAAADARATPVEDVAREEAAPLPQQTAQPAAPAPQPAQVQAQPQPQTQRRAAVPPRPGSQSAARAPANPRTEMAPIEGEVSNATSPSLANRQAPAVTQPSAQPGTQTYSATQFERSSAPQLSPEALEAAGGVVSSRYQQTHGTVVVGGEDEPVTVNMDALDALPPPGPGASLDTQIIDGAAAFTSQGGPSAAPFTVYFGHGKTDLSADDRANLAEVKAALDQYGTALRVVGHASSRTSDLPLARHKLANFDVAARRAEAVAAELARQGIDPSRILIESQGESSPVFHETMPAGEAGNRRVEIYIE
ncbi:OmpA/MotB [Tepidicaulis marinus]|uniref:OmpA/MotB n=2 Tax=Tepidicaulis marinus TaxID=1333998 RepID=A0A081B7R9_9HYPH|nr:OmpA/MotB [Tepidicaulis marinus]